MASSPPTSLGFVDAAGVGPGRRRAGVRRRAHRRRRQLSDLRDGNGRRIPSGATTSEQAVPGDDVRLTIDRDLQWVAQQSLAAAVKKSGAASGVAVVMTPDGQVLALATVPTFDPADPSTPIEQRGNAAIEDIYEPGSVLKPLTMAALIEEGIATPASTYTVPDRIVIDGEDYGDHSPHATERMTLAGILADSSNVGTIMAADPLDRETHESYLRAFGVGEPSGLGLPWRRRRHHARAQVRGNPPHRGVRAGRLDELRHARVDLRHDRERRRPGHPEHRGRHRRRRRPADASRRTGRAARGER